MDLLVLAKEPRPGRVKTRLCPPCTAEQAADIAAAALADTLAAATASGADRVVLALDGQPGDWCPPGVEVVPQGTGDLADRLATAWRSTSGPAIQIGMDTPQVGSEELRSAMEVLADPAVDAVLGPACDGGWWAIGFSGPVPTRVFRDIPTSRADTGARQRARLRRLGLRCVALEAQTDVDTWEDACAVAAAHPHLHLARTVGDVARGVA